MIAPARLHMLRQGSEPRDDEEREEVRRLWQNCPPCFMGPWVDAFADYPEPITTAQP